MKKIMRQCLLLSACMLFTLSGCGSGGGGNGSAAPTKAVVKLSTQGTVPAQSTVGGVQLTLVIPAGVTVKADNTGKTNSGVVVASGVATGADVYTGTYTPATASTDGTLEIWIANSQTGFDVGEFATITCDLASGVAPKATDFKIKSDNPDDYVIFNLTDSAHISGISIVNTVELK